MVLRFFSSLLSLHPSKTLLYLQESACASALIPDLELWLAEHRPRVSQPECPNFPPWQHQIEIGFLFYHQQLSYNTCIAYIATRYLFNPVY